MFRIFFSIVLLCNHNILDTSQNIGKRLKAYFTPVKYDNNMARKVDEDRVEKHYGQENAHQTSYTHQQRIAGFYARFVPAMPEDNDVVNTH
mmetsp:Transcript_29019/g.38135  ORF Transcript_29019/g.38135 Transcript_29019/m.38135 type:complete len:91 (+) Transcript_29019:1455-1727(+)